MEDCCPLSCKTWGNAVINIMELEIQADLLGSLPLLLSKLYALGKLINFSEPQPQFPHLSSQLIQ